MCRWISFTCAAAHYSATSHLKIPVDPQSNDPSQSDKQGVLCMCFSPSEETLIASTSKSQLYSITMSLTEISKIMTMMVTH
ncbi:hypothetical protein AB1E18_001862 [Capra hircus]